jgi:hypothetical protein
MLQIRQSICSYYLSFLTRFLRKCLLKELGVVYEVVLLRIDSAGFPRYKKYIAGLLFVLMDEIAWLSAVSDTDRARSAVGTDISPTSHSAEPNQ